MKISICVPVYKAEEFIGRCARGLFGQTHNDLEVIFVNDATPDDSIAVLRRVLEEYPGRRDRVRFVDNGKNIGSMASRMRAVAEAGGEWVGFCDADDWMDCDMLDRMLRSGTSANADIVMCNVVRNESEPLPGSRTQTVNFDGSGRDCLLHVRGILAYPLLNNKLFRRDLLDRTRPFVPPDLRIGEDLCFVAQATVGATRVVSVPDVNYHYRWNPDSVTGRSSPERTVRDGMLAYETLSMRLPPEIAAPLLQGLVCNVLLLGLKHSVLTACEYRQWRARLRALGCGFSHPDANRLRRLLMRVADVSYPLASFLNEHLSKKEISRI